MTLEKPYRAVLLDLFWTTVDMDFARFPKLRFAEGGEEKELSSTGDLLFQAACRHHGLIERAKFLSALFSLQKEIRKRWEEGVLEEVSSQKKFSRFLHGLPDFQLLPHQKINELAEIFTDIHMRSIVEATVMSKGRKEILQHLRQTHQLALVSNFDHAPSGYRILEVHGIVDYFQNVVISDECGKRKPHPELFERALKGLGVGIEETLMVGDTPVADILGAAQLGMDTAWIQRPGEVWPERLTPPTYVLRDLEELGTIPKIQFGWKK